MGSVTVTYTATSLADIAQEFEDRANRILRSRESAIYGSRAYRTLTTEAGVWQNAASILRDTTLAPKEEK